MVVSVILAASLFLAFFLSSRLQALISGPILHLAETSRLVSTKKNYSIRAVKQGQDELGDLIDGFNEMLSQIQLRDQELGRHQENLQAEVAARTAELRSANNELSEAKVKGRVRESRQERVPGQHEPRDPHAHERHHRHDGPGARYRSDAPSSASISSMVKQSGDALLTLINDILDFSKIEAGKFALDTTDFDLR